MAFPANIDLSSLVGSNGFRIDGEAAQDWSGHSVASAGDLNGDGFEDVIVGAPHPSSKAPGAAYVVFGKASGFAASLALSSLDGTNGFQLTGEPVPIPQTQGSMAGHSVASAGDVNADGFADLIVGSPNEDANGQASGAAYVVYGKATGFAANLDLSTLDGSNGFQLSGESGGDSAGISVASAGDINGDGFADMFVGSRGADPTGDSSYLGASYVVFGKAAAFPADFQLSTLDGSNGFRLIGAQPGSTGGSPVASAGDINGDGFDDLIVSTQILFDPDEPNGEYSAKTHVVFGKASGFTADFNLASLDGDNGFNYIAWAGNVSVGSAGDVNGDGFADLLVGSYIGIDDGQYYGGTAVVFGKTSGFAVNGPGILDGSNGFRVFGAAPNDAAGWSVSAAGDVNGDGFDDIIIGAVELIGALGTTDYSGEAYVVFGKASGFAATLDLADIDGVNGFKLSGVAPYDQVGFSVSSAGDVNGDGFDDLMMGSIAAHPNGIPSGSSYVVFGGAFGATVTTTGTAAAEILIGGTGDDTLTGGGGADAFHGGAGNDRIVVGDLGFVLADGGTGTDTLALGGLGLSLDLSTGLLAARIEGVERFDLRGAGDNTLKLDQLAVLGGAGTTLEGTHLLTVRGGNADTVLLVEAGWTRTGSFSNAEGAFDSYVLGNAQVHVEQGIIVPGATIVGTGGGDTIDATTTVAGQPFPTDRNDVIFGLGGNDTISALMGNDSLNGGSGDDTLDGGGGNDLLSGGNGTNMASYASAQTGVKVSLLIAVEQNTVGAGKDTLSQIACLSGSDFADTLTGDGLANRLNGGAGNDVLEGGAGNDKLNGGTGHDTASYATAAAGVKVSLATAAAQDTIGAGKDTLSAIDILIGSAFADTLTGHSELNALAGGAGDDVLIGGFSGDFLAGQSGADTASYSTAATGVTASLANAAVNTGDAAGDIYSSIENLTGSQFNDILTGNSGSNTLSGGKGADQLNGGGGGDRLLGGGGSDSLIGGGGPDTFVFDQSLVAGNVAMLVDFTHGTDTIELSLAIFAVAGPAGALDANAFFVGSVAHDADDRIIYNAATGNLLFDSDGTGAAAAKVFAVAATGLPLTASDFVLA